MDPINQTREKTHRFTLLYTGADELTEDLANALYEAGCDDALLGIQNGLLFLDFNRTSPSYKEALSSAINDVERSAAPIRLVRVEPI